MNASTPIEMFCANLAADPNVAAAFKPVKRTTTECGDVTTITIEHPDRQRCEDEKTIVKCIELSRYHHSVSIGPVQRPNGMWVAHVTYSESDYSPDADRDFGDGDDDYDDFDARR